MRWYNKYYQDCNDDILSGLKPDVKNLIPTCTLSLTEASLELYLVQIINCLYLFLIKVCRELKDALLKVFLNFYVKGKPIMKK